MEITDSACVPTFSFPFALDCHQYYELMVAQGEGRSPMTSSDAETDSKPIIIIIGEVRLEQSVQRCGQSRKLSEIGPGEYLDG